MVMIHHHLLPYINRNKKIHYSKDIIAGEKKGSQQMQRETKNKSTATLFSPFKLQTVIHNLQAMFLMLALTLTIYWMSTNNE